MKTFILVKLFIISSMLLCIPQLFAAEKTYTVGVEQLEYYPHYDFLHSETSFTKEVLDLFAKTREYHFRYRPLPVNRLFHRFLTKKLDFKYPDHPDWQVETKKNKEVVYSKQLVRIVSGTLVLPENKGRGLDKFTALGIVLGFSPLHWEPYLQTQRVKLFESSNVSTLIQQVLLERIDGADMELSVASYHLERIRQPFGLVFDPELPYIIIPFHFSTILYPEVIEEFNQFLVRNKTEIERIKKKFGIQEAGKVLYNAL